MKIYFSLIVTAALVLTACSDQDAVVETTSPEVPGSYYNLTISDYGFNTDTLQITPGEPREASDPISIPLSVSVKFTVPAGASLEQANLRILAPVTENAVLETTLSPTGNNEASGTMTLDIKRGDVGDYLVEVTGTDSRGVALNPAIATLKIVFAAGPPVLSNLIIPDSIQLGDDPQPFDVFVDVSDPSGLQDIDRVFLNSFLPNGQPSTGNPFALVFDPATENTWRRRFVLLPDEERGTYTFEIGATDLSGLSANPLVHQIVIY
ncbi:MAG: hypothetical protein CL946_12545 [Ectothiorhodospiraceae bacterium]|nr:hypothetical protein [Ectothiorhodospiraceae bacterium]